MNKFLNYFCLVAFCLSSIGLRAEDTKLSGRYYTELSYEGTTLRQAYIIGNEYGYTVEDVVNDLKKRTHPVDIRMLARLEDQETIDNGVREWIETGGRSRPGSQAVQAVKAGTPWVIPPLMEHIDGDIGNFPQSVKTDTEMFNVAFAGETVRVILSNLAAAPEFKGEVRNWVRTTKTLMPSDIASAREQLRVFWEQNKDKFESREYHLVKPPVFPEVEAEEAITIIEVTPQVD